MKFITLASRGGDYLVVASNVAWLRESENGQTLVGMVGSDAILVSTGVAETAAIILTEVNGSA